LWTYIAKKLLNKFDKVKSCDILAVHNL